MLLEVSVLVFLLQGHLISGQEVSVHPVLLQTDDYVVPCIACGMLMPSVKSCQSMPMCTFRTLAHAGTGAEPSAVRGFRSCRESPVGWADLWGRCAPVPLRVRAHVLPKDKLS